MKLPSTLFAALGLILATPGVQAQQASPQQSAGSEASGMMGMGSQGMGGTGMMGMGGMGMMGMGCPMMGMGNPGMMGMMGHSGIGPFGMRIPLLVAITDTNSDGALSLEEVQALHSRIFSYIDADKDGKLVPGEVENALRAGFLSRSNQ